MEVMMRGKSAILGMPLVGLVTCGTVHAAPRQPACVEIMAVCEQAGFVRGDAKAGDGLFVDCVVPILRGTPQRRRASKPLPQVDPRLRAEWQTHKLQSPQRFAPPPQPAQTSAPRPCTPPRDRPTPS